MASKTENASASDEFIQHKCDLCIEDDQCVEAKVFCTVCMQYLCQRCHKAHTRATVSKHHKCLTDDQMPGNISQSQLTPRCKEHPEQVLDQFCYEHRSSICTLCKLVTHKNCKKTASVSDIACTAKSKMETKLKLDSLHSLINEFERLETVSDVHITEMEEQRENLIASVRKIRTDIDQYLDTIEKDMIEKINKDIKNEASPVAKRKDEVNCIVRELRKNTEEFENLQKDGSDDQIFVASTFAEENVKVYSSILRDIRDSPLPHASLSINDMLKNFKHQVQSFGDIGIGKSKEERRRLYKEKSAVYLTEIDISSSTDTEPARVNSVETLPDGGILVSDGANDKILLLGPRYRSLCELKLSSKPFSMIVVSPAELVVALPLQSCLQSMMIKDAHELKMGSVRRTKSACFRLLKFEENIIAVAADDSFVYINLCSVDGQIIRCIRKEPGSGGLFSEFRDVGLSPDKSVIYVTDEVNGCIGVSLDGGVVFRYKEKDMGTYPGIFSDPDGCVYIACSDADKVVMVDKMTNTKKDILQNFGLKPTFMAYSVETNRLYLKRALESKINVFALI